MIWYLLYPFRGTNEPPRLSDNHIIRRAFYRHGILTAKHWLAAMLISCAIAVALAYPTLFLSENPTAGFTSKPHQAWAAARTVQKDENVQINIEMRQIWVHGTYMKALEKDVLTSALRIQQTLVGGENLTAISPAFADATKSNPITWGFHSPLMYWNNSANAIKSDLDVIKTINDQAQSSSSLDISLRPASVFAGKAFHRRKLVAADALVLTLMNRMEDGVGNKWQQKMHTLEDSACPGCSLYPPHGEISRSRVYEFTFTPVSLRENVFLAVAYSCMALYVLLSLRRLKAFHSRFGLVVTAITQMTMSVLASFTMCGVLKVNLATVPQNAYPFMVLVIGLENMFRLINAILAYPPTMATDLRIANALGDIGPLSVATAGQNLFILWLLTLVVSPGIKAFCVFAGTATVIDTFFLLTFFVAVLNVDIRRLELQDSISRSKEAAQRQKSPPPQRSWFDALVHGRLPFSTRMAGSAVTTTFILTLNYHFFERKDKKLGLRHLLGLVRGGTTGLIDTDTFAPPPMNATLTPSEWIRMQDFDTAREVMRLVNPGAQSFVIRVFAPLIVVLSGSDRTGLPQGAQAWYDAIRAFTIHQFYPFVVVVVFSVTFVTVLMNFLLWNEVPELSDVLSDRTEETLTVEHVHTPHKLDILRVSGSKKGHFVSVALDRTVAVSLYEQSQGLHFCEALPVEFLSTLAWPIRNATIDTSGQWLAFHTGDEGIVLCNLKSRAVRRIAQYPDDHPTLLFDFAVLPYSEGSKLSFIALTSAGRLVTCSVEGGVPSTAGLSEYGLIAAMILTNDNMINRLVTVSETFTITSFDFKAGVWSQAASQSLPVQARHGRSNTEVHIIPLNKEDSNVFLVETTSAILMVDSLSLQTLPSIAVDKAGRVITGPTLRCTACGSLGLQTIGTAAEDSRADELTLSVFRGGSVEQQGICSRRQTTQCGSCAEAVSEAHTLQTPGCWIALPSQAVLGLRRRQRIAPVNGYTDASQLRQRRAARRAAQTEFQDDAWEAYWLSLDGDVATVDVACSASDCDSETPSLYVTKAGPAVLLDDYSAAVAFGNTVKVLRAAKNGSASGRSTAQGLERHSAGVRKSGGSRKVQ